MHLLIITNLFPNSVEPNRGIFVARMAEQLKAHCEVSVVSPLPWCPRIGLLRRFTQWYGFSLVNREESVNGFRVRYPKYLALPKLGWLHSLFLYIALWPAVRRIHRERPVDVINAHWLFPDGVAARWIANRLKVPVVLSARGCDLNAYSRLPLRRPQITGAIKGAARVTVVSEAQRQRAQELGVRNGTVEVIGNGVDQARYRPGNTAALRAQLGLRQDRKIILFVGQLVEVKGIPTLIHAAKILKGRLGETFQVVAVGDGPLRRRLMDEAARLGLQEQFRFCGERPHAEIPLWMGASDLLCLPSVREGCPNVVLESLACGKPVVASRVGGIPEVVGDENGVLCAPQDSQSFADGLAETLQRSWNPELIRASVRHRSWEETAQRYFRVIEAASATSKGAS